MNLINQPYPLLIKNISKKNEYLMNEESYAFREISWLPVLDAFRTLGTLNSYINCNHLPLELNTFGEFL